MFHNILIFQAHFPTSAGKGTKFSRQMYEAPVHKGTKIGRQRYEVVAERTKAVALLQSSPIERSGWRTNESPCPCGRQTYEVVGKGTKPAVIERIGCDPNMRTLALRHAAIAAP
jgi:hypothetical protein